MFSALDMMLLGYDKVIGPDFMLAKRDPSNAEYGYIDKIINLKAKTKLIIPENLEVLSKEYLNDIKTGNNLSTNLIKCVHKIYGIRGKVLSNMTVNPI